MEEKSTRWQEAQSAEAYGTRGTNIYILINITFLESFTIWKPVKSSFLSF